ncbi:MAG: glycosyltransferase family 2 protein [Anaerolineales bacterium]|nr:glycosyltransferase family 2 protein [Anaerolineae bacterium]PWB55067.1 MAG: glycosyltransferase family 2 protein [Anaerolineales bacterium]
MVDISIIVPCYNEEATIRKLLDAICAQTVPMVDIEVVIADGLSTDGTRAVINDYRREHPELEVHIVDNTQRVIPSGLNRAIEGARGSYIVRMDAHSIPDPDYIRKCVDELKKGLGDNVGGIWKIHPGNSSWIARSIALAAAHPLGAGDARYRIGGVAQEVETVPFGTFHRDIFEQIGMFDESLLTNEDYEFNTRIRQSGGKVWLDPSITSIYYARPTLRELAAQYWRYGYWKAQMLRKYPKTLRWRQAIPPVFVAVLIILGLLVVGMSLARWLLAIIVILYTIILLGIGIQMSLQHKKMSYIIGVPLALATIQIAWGAAFLWGMFRKPALNTKPL